MLWFKTTYKNLRVAMCFRSNTYNFNLPRKYKLKIHIASIIFKLLLIVRSSILSSPSTHYMKSSFSDVSHITINTKHGLCPDAHLISYLLLHSPVGPSKSHLQASKHTTNLFWFTCLKHEIVHFLALFKYL